MAKILDLRGRLKAKGTRAYDYARGIVWDDAAQAGAEFVGAAARQIRGSGKYRVETFDQAVQRLGLAPGALDALERTLYVRHAFFSGLALLSLVVASASNGVAMANALFVAAAFATAGFRLGFRRHQVETRDLCSVGDFLAAGGWYRAFVPLVRE